MIKMGKESKLSTADVIEKAVLFFGSGEGLKIVAHDNCCARFEGVGGYVYVQASALEDSNGSQVAVEGREWEFQIRQFIKSI